MIEVIPAILSKSFGEVEDKLKFLDDFSTWAHLDIADGKFVPNETWHNPGDLEVVGGKIKIETHLMIKNPEEIFDTWAQVSDRIYVHPESTDNLQQMIDYANGVGVAIGLAFRLDTQLSDYGNFLEKVNHVNLLAMEYAGVQGEPFSEKVLTKIELIKEDYPHIKVSVDGGIGEDSAPAVVTAGADRLVVGSDFWSAPNPEIFYHQLENL